MKRISFRPSSLQIIYLVIFFLLFASIILTPKLITKSLYLSDNMIIEEELVEGVLLFILLLLGVVIVNLYKQESNRQKDLMEKIRNDKKTTEERLTDSFKYIGMLNVQIQEIKSIFNNTDKYPETKNEFKKAFRFFCERVFGIVKSNWVLFRIINSSTQKTLSEHFETRMGFSGTCPHISNKMIIESQHIESLTIVISNPQNLNILVGCILPVENVSSHERIFIQAITNELTMLYVILNSSYYRKENNVLRENQHN